MASAGCELAAVFRSFFRGSESCHAATRQGDHADAGSGPLGTHPIGPGRHLIDRDDRSAVESGGPAEVSEPAAREPARGVEVETATVGRTKSEDCATMERVVERANMWLAYQRVVRNKGAAGVDDVSVSELKDWLAVHWPSVKKALLEGRYLPRPVRRVDIPKPSGGVRTLGIPTVVDRLIQQAQAQAYIGEGRRGVVDLDLEKFLDRVNHDVLMSRVARRACGPSRPSTSGCGGGCVVCCGGSGNARRPGRANSATSDSMPIERGAARATGADPGGMPGPLI